MNSPITNTVKEAKPERPWVGTWNHLWIRLHDGLVIDCTADQFNRGKRKHPQVHVGKPLDIHKGGKRYATQ